MARLRVIRDADEWSFAQEQVLHDSLGVPYEKGKVVRLLPTGEEYTIVAIKEGVAYLKNKKHTIPLSDTAHTEILSDSQL